MNLPLVTLWIFLLLVTTVFSLTGNALVCLAFYRNRRLRTITNFYVLSLAVADITATISVFPVSAIAAGLRKWPFNFDFCQFNGFVTYFWAQMSVNILTLTAVNRYFCIIKPHLYPALFTKKKTLCLILLVLLVTFTACLTAALAAPILVEWDNFYLFCSVSEDQINKGFSIFISGSVTSTLSLIFFCYGSVYRAIRQHNLAVNPSLQDSTSQVVLSAHEIQASRVLLATVLGFCVCWIPATAVRSLQTFAHISLPSFWLSFSTIFAAFSSWINPIIYGVMNRAMRKEFLKSLRCQSENWR